MMRGMAGGGGGLGSGLGGGLGGGGGRDAMNKMFSIGKAKPVSRRLFCVCVFDLADASARPSL